jgi:hypothetical protein
MQVGCRWEQEAKFGVLTLLTMVLLTAERFEVSENLTIIFSSTRCIWHAINKAEYLTFSGSFYKCHRTLCLNFMLLFSCSTDLS